MIEAEQGQVGVQVCFSSKSQRARNGMEQQVKGSLSSSL